MTTFRLREQHITHPNNDYTLILERVDDTPTIKANDAPAVQEVAYFRTTEKPTASAVVVFLNACHPIPTLS